MFQRRISDQEVRHVIEMGDTIATYPEDSPYPCRLVLGWYGSRPLHVVAADNAVEQATIIITVYEPNRVSRGQVSGGDDNEVCDL
jgi:Domain of unknown function (DUF4258)